MGKVPTQYPRERQESEGMGRLFFGRFTYSTYDCYLPTYLYTLSLLKIKRLPTSF